MLTFDEATLDDSMNEAIENIVNIPIDERSDAEQSEIYNYYVACTRPKFKLNNAKYIAKQKVKDEFDEAIEDNLKRFLQEDIEI